MVSRAQRRRRFAAGTAACAVWALIPGVAIAQGADPDPAEVQQAGALEAGKLDVPRPPADAVLPQVEPVIPDDEFNRRIPALDPNDDGAIDRPLESIEAFERRLAAEAGGEPTASQPAAAPALAPALADGTATEQIGDAPVRDAELARPLPALGEFEVTPVQFAEAEEAEPAEVEVAYSVRVDGLEPADKLTPTDLEREFHALSALKKGDGKAANVAMLTARLKEDSELLQTVLASEGWYMPQIRTRLQRGGEGASEGRAQAPAQPQARPAGRQPLVAVLSVVPGPRFVLSDIVIKADPTQPPSLIADNLALKVGEPIVAERVQGAEAQVALALPQNGYPFAEVGERDVLLDPDTGEGVYTLPVTVGPRGRFDGFRTTGDLAFDVRHVATLARFRKGELYDSRKVDDLRKALIATNLFSTVSVEPARTGQVGADGTEAITLDVKQDAGPPRTIAGSVGYAAGEGLTAEATWTHRNMFPPEGALIVHGLAGTRQQGAGVTFRRANAGQRDRAFEVVAEAFHNDYVAYSAYTGRLAARVSRDSTPIWQKKLTYAYGVELLATAETDFDAASGTRKRNTFYVAGLNGQVGFDRTNDLLDPTRGFRVTSLIQPEATVKDGFNPYLRARIDASGYFSVSDSLVLAGRLRFGTIQGAGLFEIAPSRRLYAGGGGSVRGFAFQKLGELAPDGDPVGGRSLNEGSIEGRYRFGNFGVVAFVDAGQAYRETTPQFDDLRYGVGVGGRFYTNFGPVRLDVATPLARRRGESRFNIYVSIGQAF